MANLPPAGPAGRSSVILQCAAALRADLSHGRAGEALARLQPLRLLAVEGNGSVSVIVRHLRLSAMHAGLRMRTHAATRNSDHSNQASLHLVEQGLAAAEIEHERHHETTESHQTPAPQLLSNKNRMLLSTAAQLAYLLCSAGDHDLQSALANAMSPQTSICKVCQQSIRAAADDNEGVSELLLHWAFPAAGESASATKARLRLLRACRCLHHGDAAAAYALLQDLLPALLVPADLDLFQRTMLRCALAALVAMHRLPAAAELLQKLALAPRTAVELQWDTTAALALHKSSWPATSLSPVSHVLAEAAAVNLACVHLSSSSTLDKAMQALSEAVALRRVSAGHSNIDQGLCHFGVTGCQPLGWLIYLAWQQADWDAIVQHAQPAGGLASPSNANPADAIAALRALASLESFNTSGLGAKEGAGAIPDAGDTLCRLASVQLRWLAGDRTEAIEAAERLLQELSASNEQEFAAASTLSLFQVAKLRVEQDQLVAYLARWLSLALAAERRVHGALLLLRRYHDWLLCDDDGNAHNAAVMAKLQHLLEFVG